MVRFQRALALLREHKYKEAKELLTLLLSENPSDPDILFNLGMLHTELGEPDKAIEMLTLCLARAEEKANVHVAIGFAWSEKGDLRAARHHTEEALTLDADNPYAHRNLGGILAKLGDHHGAVSHMRKAYTLKPDEPSIVYGLALALRTAGDVGEADRLFAEVIKMDAPDALKELARDERRKTALEGFKSQGLRTDAVMYCLEALISLGKRTEARVREIAFEIALLGRSGLDVNNPDKRYKLRSLSGEFSGLELACMMYVGFKIIDPTVDIGFDMAREYAAAQQFLALGTQDGA